MSGMTKSWKTGKMWRVLPLAALVSLGSAIGCKNFFTPINDTGSGTTVINTGDYAYVISQAADTITGFSIGAGSFTALSGFPLTLPFLPTSAVVTPSNDLLYVAGDGVLYGYTIASDGVLTQIKSSTGSFALVNANIVSMDASPDGNWLIALDASVSTATIDYYMINSDGQLTVETSNEYALTNGATIVPNSIRISPLGDYIAVALGTGGDVLYSFDTSTGAIAALTQVNTGSGSGADQALAFDSTETTLYIARSGTGGGVYPYLIGSSGLASDPVAGAPFALGNGAASMVIDTSGKYLYVGNKADGTISGFSIGTGSVLTALTGSPYATGTSVNALARDNSGDHILSANLGGTPDIDLYNFDSTTAGKLDIAATGLTGNTAEPAGAVALALTH